MTKPKKTFYFNTQKNWQNQYNKSKENIGNLKADLKSLYAIKDLENRAFRFKQLKDKYGMPLDQYLSQQRANLDSAKKVLTSRYVIDQPYSTTGKEPLKYTSNIGETLETSDSMGGTVTMGTTINPFYNKELDLKSEYHVKRRLKDGSTYEADVKTQDASEFKDEFTDTVHTDAWGRDYDHQDFGVDPANVNRVTTPTTTSNNNNNNKTVEVTDGTDKKKVINNGGAGAAAFGEGTTSSGLGAKDGDLIANNPGETPKNRLELMTKEIAENPSRIQEGLIESGFTAERLAKLKIKHQDWKNRNKIKVNQPVKT